MGKEAHIKLIDGEQLVMDDIDKISIQENVLIIESGYNMAYFNMHKVKYI